MSAPLYLYTMCSFMALYKFVFNFNLTLMHIGSHPIKLYFTDYAALSYDIFCYSVMCKLCMLASNLACLSS